MQIVAERAKRELDLKVIIFDPTYVSEEFAGDIQWGEVKNAEEIAGCSPLWY